MAVTDKDFRPENNRSVWIQGRIDEEMVGRIAPIITSYRSQSLDPITLYINSNGGPTRSAETIYRLLKTPDLNGGVPRLITIAVGNAKSAAADLLSLGNYAYSYPVASIHFHGARMGAVENVTVEDSYELASSLGETNNVAAMKLANASIQRLVLRYALLQEEFGDFRGEAKKPLSDIECFVGILQARNPSESVCRVTKDSLKKCLLINRMSIYIAKRIKPPNRKLSPAEIDANIFKQVLNFELQADKSDDWELDAEGIARVSGDYLILRDYYKGNYTNSFTSILRRFGTSFLSEKQTAEYEKLAGASEQNRNDWLLKATGHKVQEFWYFVVSLWRHLQEEENSLTPIEAYWLGAVDEIVGSNLPNFRQVAEMGPDPPAKS